MPLPAQTFPVHNMNSLLNYINTKIIPNGMELIIGEIHNNVENGLAQFILQSILNYNTATVVSSGGALLVNSPITYIVNSTPASLSWVDDNWFNELYIINATGDTIPLASGYSYFDEYVTAITTIPANTGIHIAKTANGSWIKVGTSNSSGGGGTTTVSAEYIQFTVGDPSTNPPINDGETIFTVSDTNVVEGSVMLFVSGIKRLIGVPDDAQSYVISYNPAGFTIAFYYPVFDGLAIEINYLKGAVPPSSAGLVGAIIPINGSDFYDSTTYINPILNGYYLQVFWNDINRYLNEGVEWNYQPGGGFYISMMGFDATLNPTYKLYAFVTGRMVA